jgi:hypothetical protein
VYKDKENNQGIINSLIEKKIIWNAPTSHNRSVYASAPVLLPQNLFWLPGGPAKDAGLVQ